MNEWKHVERMFNLQKRKVERNKRKIYRKIVLPFTLYGDDFEVNNPLGSHSGFNKEHAVYCSLTGEPSEFESLLENIFLFQLYK